MGARQSKRSVDITTTPKKGDGEVAVEGEGKLEKIGENDAKVTTNGAVHPEIEFADKDEGVKDEPLKEEIKENGVSDSEEPNSPDAAGDQLNESAAVIDTEKVPESAESKVEETPESKKNKNKEKKKKWSFRSISFSKKDKSKPSKDSEKNGDVKEVAEENAEENATSPSAETPKTEEPKTPEAAAPVTNGEATSEELSKPAEEAAEAAVVEAVKPVVEAPTKVEEAPKAVEESVPEAVKETPVESTPSPIIPETVEDTKVEDTKPVETPVVEETKEVRNEEIPPPLPSSNPPSPVMVFAESTKADALTADQVPVSPVSVSVVETIPENLVVEPVVEALPQAASSPVVDRVPEHESAPVVESKETIASNVSPPSSPPKEPELVVCSSPELSQNKSDDIIVPEPVAASVDSPSKDVVLVEDVLKVLDSQQAVEVCKLESKSVEEVLESQPILIEPSLDVSGNAFGEIAEPVLVAAPETSPKETPTPEVAATEISESIVEPVVSNLLDLAPASPEVAPVAHADSLPDISTESLPSMPEPLSESLPEPMSLPPVEFVPEPITCDAPLPDPPIVEQISSTPLSEIPPPTEPPAVLTNGNSIGLASPLHDDVSLPPPSKEGPLKQVPADLPEANIEIRQEDGEKPSETVAASTPAAVEE